MSTGAITLIIGFVGLIVLGGIGFLLIKLTDHESLGFGLLFGGLVVLILTFFVGSSINEDQHWNYAIKQDYTFYVDGQEVEPENVDPDHYNITYDDDNHKVMLSPIARWRYVDHG